MAQGELTELRKKTRDLLCLPEFCPSSAFLPG